MSFEYLLDKAAIGGTEVGSSCQEVEKMLCNDPQDRVRAQDAQHNASFRDDRDGLARRSTTFDPPPYWAKTESYYWHRSKFMEAVVMKLLRSTTCAGCQRHKLATDVQILKVCRVENRFHWRSYAARRMELVERNSSPDHKVRVAQRNKVGRHRTATSS